MREITSLRIRILGDDVLRRKSRAVRHITGFHRDLLSKMAQMMYESSGIGLAAPQVGVNENMIVADIGSGLYKLINPRIIKREGSLALEEGCLSVPGVCIKVKRAKKVKVVALDENGKHIEIEAENVLACVLQHEIDHLKGKLIVDYASFLEKVKMKRALAELRKRFKDEELPKSETKSCKLQL